MNRRDIYAQQLQRQNEGLYCEYCFSESGHRHTCVLLNGGTVSEAEVPALSPEEFEQWDDNLFLHNCGVAGL